MLTILLYSGPDCCLCERAEAMLERSAYRHLINVEKQDIYRDKRLLVTYKTRIPVLRERATGASLAWPFDAEALEQWLQDVLQGEV